MALFASAATADPATHFDVSAPESATAGDSFDITVTARDGEAVDPTYTGTVHFTSSDDQAALPEDYTFTEGDAGVATISVELRTAGNQTVTATDTVDGDITGTSGDVSVASGPHDHFDVANPGTQTAGTSFDVTLTAEDAYGNAASGWTDTNGCVVFSEPLNSPPPSETSPSYPDDGGLCPHPDASLLSFDASGQATANITLYRATTGDTVPSTTELIVTDTAPPPNETGSSGTFTVNPGGLARFAWTDQPGASQTAGVAFDRVEVTSYDQWDNIKTDYTGGSAVFSGLGTSPNGTAPVYGFSWGNGIAISTTVTDYKAETASLLVTDGSVNASSSGFTVAPGPLDHFAVANPGPQTAGDDFDVTVGAEDAYGNAASGWTDTNGCVVFSGPFNSPPPSLTPPDYPDGGSCSHPDASELSFDASGQATASVTLYRATTTHTAPDSTTNLTVTDTAPPPNETGSSGTFTVDPGLLGYFTIANIGGQTAGTPFSVSATAWDQWDNLKTNYAGGATLSGNLGNSTRGCGAGDASPCSPVYGAFAAWVNGVSSASVTAFKAESGRQVTVSHGTPSGASNTFAVSPNDATAPPTRFSEQPTLTERLEIINDGVGVKVTVEDFWGNPRSGDNVTVAIGTNPSGGTLSGTLTQPTNGSGVATFGDLSIDNSGLGYTLVATTSPTVATTTSNGFDVANDVNPCSGTCSATGSTATTAATTTASGLGSGALSSRLGPAAAAAPGDARLGMTVNPSVQVPAGVCGGGFQQLGDGFGVSTVQAGGNQPSFRVVATLDKAVVKASGKTGASKFDICLGAFNVTNPPGAPGATNCTDPATSKSWLTKNGTCAVLDGGFYWGLVADYPSKVKNCPTASGSGLFPGVLSKQKTNAGDVVITFCVPYPWDEKGGFG